jgi:2-polyprenyl-3-methyl-5-hydroxy-6-metoxy-1,4-benzoquinol methylase
MALDSASLERIIPALLEQKGATGRPTLELHLMRYKFAVQHLLPGRVLDIACGVGYGTKLLGGADGIRSAIGVDLSADAIEYARSNFGQNGIEFVASDALEFSDATGFENIVSLETIEHVLNPPAFLTHLVGMLKPDGILIGSVPITPSVDVNPHHRTDFTESSFEEIARVLGLVKLGALYQDQTYNPIAILSGKEERSGGIRRNILSYYRAHPRRLWARVSTTLRYGFKNRYLTIAWRKA